MITKFTLAFLGAAGGALALGIAPKAPVALADPEAAAAALPFEPIGEFHMILEQNSTDGDAEVVVVLDAEEEFERVSLRGPSRRPIVELKVKGAVRSLGLKELLIESGEPDIPSVLAAFPEGLYTIEAKAISGATLAGEATLSHTLLSPPSFTPNGGALVDPANVMVAWSAVAGAAGYILEIEEDALELNLTVKLPASATSFVVPAGWLVRDTEYEIGMASITADGNLNFGESTFVTMP